MTEAPEQQPESNVETENPLAPPELEGEGEDNLAGDQEPEETKEKKKEKDLEVPDNLKQYAQKDIVDAEQWGTKTEKTKLRPEKKKKVKKEKKIKKPKVRVKHQYKHINLLLASCFGCCALLPIVALGVFYREYIENPIQETMFTTILKTGTLGAIFVNAICMFLGCGGCCAITAREQGQVKNYMRGIVLTMVLLICVMVLGAVFAFYSSATPFNFGTSDPYAKQASVYLTIDLFMIFADFIGILCLALSVYNALMMQDELQDDERRKDIIKKGKTPPKERAISHWWLVMRRYIPSRERIIEFLQNPHVGSACILISAVLNFIVGGLSFSVGGIYNIAGGLFRAIIAVNGILVIRKAQPRRVFSYGRKLVLLMMMIVISSTAYMGHLLRKTEDDAESQIQTTSEGFLIVFGSVTALEVFAMFWCFWCSAKRASILALKKREEELLALMPLEEGETMEDLKQQIMGKEHLV